ncbi:hypothetical protein Q8A67_025827 [Cirrhinus molitorella]|uniref:Uncharacterized protein n=1 Tax=Cirrhinus molitorella TaxID=172907 RepID=A0AA88NWT8_9TELE|nr:hypothetical protein Q8A67_025827 [Cirrhinus molitorella]
MSLEHKTVGIPPEREEEELDAHGRESERRVGETDRACLPAQVERSGRCELDFCADWTPWSDPYACGSLTCSCVSASFILDSAGTGALAPSGPSIQKWADGGVMVPSSAQWQPGVSGEERATSVSIPKSPKNPSARSD